MSRALSQYSELGVDDSVSQIMAEDDESIQGHGNVISQETLKSVDSSGAFRPLSLVAYFMVTADNLEEARGFLKVMLTVVKYSNC
jgi:hypothetical protein